MARLFDADNTLKRLRNRYRLVVMNDDTFEEVVTFKLSRLSVGVTLSTIFVLLVGLVVALITFTNLKYYLPGYGSQSQRKELIFYKNKIDSLERSMQYKDQYLESLKKVLSGDVKSTLDTATLKIPEVERSTH
jgi:predicted PurR-regulated permease PerM